MSRVEKTITTKKEEIETLKVERALVEREEKETSWVKRTIERYKKQQLKERTKRHWKQLVLKIITNFEKKVSKGVVVEREEREVLKVASIIVSIEKETPRVEKVVVKREERQALKT